MSPAEIKALRKELRCTPLELAAALGVDDKTVMAWEQDQLFPTKRYIARMEALRAAGAGSVPRKRRGSKKEQSTMQVLADPEIWALLRKLIAHPDLRQQALELASHYDEPE